MTARHRALLVEDDLVVAEQLKGLLQGLGYECMHAASQGEAEQLVTAHDFCFALMDMLVRRSEHSIASTPEAGLSLVRAIRSHHPARNVDRHHYLQILLMSAAADPVYADGARFCGCDEILEQRLILDRATLGQTIALALRRSSRESHVQCEAIAARSRAHLG
jgi:CheY-like chemotaxis protein